jgi:hypothetical protein
MDIGRQLEEIMVAEPRDEPARAQVEALAPEHDELPAGTGVAAA